METVLSFILARLLLLLAGWSSLVLRAIAHTPAVESKEG
jgi:hypothetical protein